MRFQKQNRIDMAETARMLQLVLIDDERDRFLSQSDRAALKDAESVLRSKLALDAGRELAKLSRTG